MSALRSAVSSALSIVETGSTAVAAVVILALNFLVVIDVVGRKVFSAPLSGTTDIAENTLVAVVFLGIASVQRLKGHIRIEMLLTGLTTKRKQLFDLASLVLALLVSAPITWYTGQFAWKSLIERDYTMGIARVPVWPAKLIAVFGLGLLCAQLTLDIIETIIDMYAEPAPEGTPGEGGGR